MATLNIEATNDAGSQGGTWATDEFWLHAAFDWSVADKCGMYFPAVAIPNGATITTAYIQVYGTASAGTATLTNLYMNDVDNAAGFTTEANFDGRAVTAAIAWDNITATWNGAYRNSPEMKTIVQAIVDRVGWATGQDMAVLWKDDGSTEGSYRYFSSSEDTDTNSPPILHIEYTTEVAEEATYTAVPLVITMPSVTATYVLAATSAITALSLLFTVPAVTASYEQETSASYTPVPVEITVPNMTATGIAEYSADYTALSIVVTVPSTTSTYESELSVTFTPASVLLTVPSTTATGISEWSASYIPLSVLLTVPSITATSGSEQSAAYTPVPVVITIPSTTATLEVSASYTALSLLLTIPEFTATYAREESATFTAISLVLTVPNMTASRASTGVILKEYNGAEWVTTWNGAVLMEYNGASWVNTWNKITLEV